MLKIKKLKFWNAGRFVEPTEIDFESKPQLFQVDAQNKNTNGSSGSGKSTIFNVLEYLLGVNDIPVTILQSRLTKDGIGAEAVIDKDGEEYTIHRSKSEGLTIKSAKGSVTGSTKVAEEELQKIIGIKPELFRPMLHKRQGEGGFFLGMRPSEMHNFLVEALNLDEWTVKADKAEAEAKLHKETFDRELAILSGLNATHQNLVETLQSLVEPQKDFDESVEADLRNKIITQKQELQTVEENQALQLANIPQPMMETAPDKSVLDSLNRAWADRRNELATAKSEKENTVKKLNLTIHTLSKNVPALERLKADLPNFQAQFDELRQHILETKDSKCPTCKQVWEGGDRDKAFDALVDKAKSLSALISRNEAEILGLPILKEQLSEAQNALKIAETVSHSDLEKNLNDAWNELSAKQSEILNAESVRSKNYKDRTDFYNAQIQLVKDQFASDLSARTTEINSLVMALKDHENKKTTFQKMSDQYQTTKRTIDEKIKDTVSISTACLNRKDVAGRAWRIAEESSKILKNFINQLFQDTLADIATRATKILNGIPNTATASIQFESFKETKSGTIKQETNPVLSMDGEIGIPIKSISGGERSSIDLAVDLAVIDMIENVSGKGIDLMIFDEPFNGLDGSCRENCLEMLKQNLGNKRVIIVDHSNETKEAVPDKIMVIREGQFSRVENVE